MTSTTTGPNHEAPGSIGRILAGPYSDALKKQLRMRIDACRTFEEANSPAIFYISAWRRDQDTIWYE